MHMRLLVFVLLITTLAAAAQRKVRVPQGFGTLNNAIGSDTIANGQRKDPNTIYVLQRGGVYVLSGTLLASGFTLNIEAEEGTGPRPFVMMGFLLGGTQVEECFSIFNGVRFKSVHLTAVDEVNTFIARILSVDAPDARLEFYDCIFDGSGQTLMRLNSANAKVYMRNCTVSRMGRPSNPDNGRVIDDRGNPVDSIVVENNTWYDITSRIVRDGGATINYVRFNQNTFVNVGQRFAAVGQVNQFYMNNNIIVNPRFFGNADDATPPVTVSLEFSPVGTNPVVNLNNNNIYTTPDLLTAWQQTGRTPAPFVSPTNESLLSSAQGIVAQPLAFSNGPVNPTEIVIATETGNGSTVPDWDWAGSNNSLPWQLDALAYHDFSYPTTVASYTGSTTGEPLGDLRWFPGFEIKWNLQELIKESNQQLALYQNSDEFYQVSAGLLAALQGEITQANAVMANAGATNAATSDAYDELQAALNAFKASFVITESPERGNEDAFVYPNPTADAFFVSNRLQRYDALQLYDMSGRLVKSESINNTLHRIDITELPYGIYLVKLSKAGEHSVVVKIIKAL